MKELPRFMSEEELASQINDLRTSSRRISAVAKGCLLWAGLCIGWAGNQAISEDLDPEDAFIGILGVGPAIISYPLNRLASRYEDEAISLQLESTNVKFEK